MEKATRQHLKDHNSRLVLRTIFHTGENSRAGVARLTGLTRPTISSIVAELINEGLIVEVGQGPSAGGKPPTLLTVDPCGRQMIAVDLSGDAFRAHVLDLRGEINASASLPAAGLRAQEGLDTVYRLIEAALAQTNAPLLGIGVATPGLVDPQQGVVLRAVNLDWIDLPLRQLLAERFGYPVHVANDSHMAALAEYTYGDELDSNNLIVLRIGRGIGAGIILDGRLFYGDGFGAGEIGHVVVDPDGDLCTCGNRGCLEMTSSIRAILNKVASTDTSQSALDSIKPPTWQGFSEAVDLHDPLAVDIAVLAGRHLGMAAANLVGALNINTIVLAGRLADVDGLLLDAVIAEMHQRVLPSMAQATKVRFSSLGPQRAPHIVSLGCAALLLHQELGII